MKLFCIFARMVTYTRQPEMGAEPRGIILSPFTTQLWLAALAAIMLLAISLYVTWKFSTTHEARSARNSKENLSHSAVYVFGSFCQQGE